MRIRSIKPEFWGYRGFTALPYDLRLLAVGLWSYVDDNGVGVDDERKVAADLFGTDDDPVAAREFVREGLARLSRTLDPVSGKPLLYRYTVGGRSYLFGTTWEGDLKQRVDHPNKPRYPRYDDPDAILTPSVASDSGDSRETLASLPGIPPPGTGEQGNRGTDKEHRSPTESATQGLFGDDSIAAVKKPEAGSDDDPDWQKFWSIYPLKKGKEAARRAWRGAVKQPGVTAAIVIAGAEAYRDDPARKPGYTAHASTWLNGGRWTDEPEPAVPRSRNGHTPWQDPDQSAYTKEIR